MDTHLQNYKLNGFNQVQGWCSTDTFKIINFLNSLPINKKGGIAEIGVYHGKFYILLNAIVDVDFNSYAIDIFDKQHLNPDFKHYSVDSVTGNLETFKNNLQQYDVHKGKNTIIIAGDSTDPALQLTKNIEPGSLKFVSVDGGHSVEHVLNDLKIAEELVSNEGVVIVDDILNETSLGVYEGVVRYLETKPTLVPIIMGHNKLYMSKISYRDYYFDSCQNTKLFKQQFVNNFWGYKIMSYPYFPNEG
jgi:hypothetical protein